MYVSTSLPPALALPPKKGVVRAQLFVAGYYVSPRPGGCDRGSPVPWGGPGGECCHVRDGGDTRGGDSIDISAGADTGAGEAGVTGGGPERGDSASALEHDLPTDSAAASRGEGPLPSSVMVVTLLHLDLGNGVPRTVYWFVARSYANVMEYFRRYAVKSSVGREGG